MSACSDNQSTILPFPSSPPWAPTTTTLAIPGLIPLQSFTHKHEAFGNRFSSTALQVRSSLFRVHAPSSKSRPGPLACEAHKPIMEAADLGKQEGPLTRARNHPQ